MPNHNPANEEIQPIDARKRLEADGRLHWFHWLAVGLSFMVTFCAWYYSDNERDARVKAQFDREADQVIELVLERMAKYEDALAGGVALLDTMGGDADLHEWRQYSESLHLETKYPGVNGIGLIHAMDKSAAPAYLAKQRELRPDFRIHPEHQIDVTYPITYIEPVAQNHRAVGLDMAHEVNRFTAAIKARDSGIPQITGPIILVQSSQPTPGFLFFQPYYQDRKNNNLAQRRENFVGLVYAPFIVKELMAGVLEKERRHVGLRLLDGDEVLYDEHNTKEADYDADPLFTRNVNVDMYGRTWTYDIRSAKSFRQASNDSQPLTILVGGLVIDSLLILLFVAISRASRRALGYADLMTSQLEANNQLLENEVEERKQAEEALRQSNESFSESQTKLRGVFDQCFNFVGLMSLEGHLLQANRTALRAAGVAEEDVLDRPFWETAWWSHSKAQQERLQAAIKKASGGEIDRFEATHLAADGTTIVVDFSLSPIHDDTGDVVFLIPEGRDITQEKQREAELKQLLEELARSNQELEQFAYVASHDLQEPLRKISSYAQLLREECGENFNETGHSYLTVMIDGANRLKRLVNDLLSFSRITTRGKDLVPTDAETCLRIALDNLEVSVKQSEAKITFDPLPNVMADDGQLTMLIQNLLGNAIKYRGKETPIIHVGCRDLGEMVEFVIRDNGIGIDSQFFDRIFEIFQRLHNRREYSGTGIGLAICKRIVERFNGQIRVESTLGEGSAFYFSLIKANVTGGRLDHGNTKQSSAAMH